MPKITNVILVLRNNWKKSTFALAVLTYGVNYAKNAYDNKKLMREYCLLASRYGDVANPVIKPFRNVTVVLNPAANKRNSKVMFDKYCAPLLHLAGLAVTIVYTEYAGQAKDMADNLDPKTDTLVIAGGDGTLSEVITGLLRRVQDNKEVLKKLPLGVLPLGRSNSLSNALLGNREEVQALADSTMAIIDGSIKTVDIMKIEPLDDEENSKPVYGLVQVEWGSFRNAKASRDKYWYFGYLRDYVSYLFTKAEMGDWECTYTMPCKGCCKCVTKQQVNNKWWSMFMPNTSKPETDYSKVVNEECGKLMQKDLSTVEIAIKTTTVSTETNTDAPHLVFSAIPGDFGWTNFVSEGWRRLRGKESTPVTVTAVRELQLVPKEQKENDWLSIDNENFEVKPMKITILPKAVNIFQPRLNGYVQLHQNA
ncbi:hypothetical protein RUM43_010006 [Polyplax serrata]|uniref:Acylglycerol kinase, mitochondrial n=1 Tax=Polyplax serrata TaxID=468196 RepID=A0AAN8PVA1_POLSC